MEACTIGDVTVISLPTYFSRYASDEVIDRYRSQVYRSGHDYVIDMADVKHVYSTTARLIIQLLKAVAVCKSRLCVVNATEGVENALHALHFTDHIPVYSSMVDFELERMSMDAMAA